MGLKLSSLVRFSKRMTQFQPVFVASRTPVLRIRMKSHSYDVLFSPTLTLQRMQPWHLTPAFTKLSTFAHCLFPSRWTAGFSILDACPGPPSHPPPQPRVRTPRGSQKLLGFKTASPKLRKKRLIKSLPR